MKSLKTAAIVGWWAFCAWNTTLNASSYELSRGRQVLLNRGLQIQSTGYWTSAENNGFNVDRWRSANFTGMGFMGGAQPGLLARLHAGTQWSRWGNPTDPYPQLLPAEMPYVGTFVGYQYLDEPAMTQGSLDEMRTTYPLWNTLYPNALAYTDNNASVPDNSADLAHYMQYAKPDMLMFNYYPVFSFESDNRNFWYKTMQMHRTTALAGYDGTGNQPIAYGQYLNYWRSATNVPLPSESYVRLQQNASWAFGFTTTSAYVYNADAIGTYSVMFSSFGDDSPTPVFDYVAEANRQSRNLGPALVRLVSTDIRMIPATYGTHQEGPFWNRRTVDDNLPLPDGIQAWTPGAGGDNYITAITPLGKDHGDSHIHSDVLIGYFQPLAADNPQRTFLNGLHFMIVNGASGTPFAQDASGDPASASAEWYRLAFDFQSSGFDSLVRLSRDTGQVELVPLVSTGGSTYCLDLNLPGGTGDLFAFWDASKPLPTIPEPGTFLLLTSALCVTSCLRAWRRR